MNIETTDLFTSSWNCHLLALHFQGETDISKYMSNKCIANRPLQPTEFRVKETQL